MFGAVWTKQGTWMLFGTESSGCKNKILLPLLTSGDFQGSHDQVIDELNLHYSRWISDVASTPVEGKINKLKYIKRSMYGRGGFPLLRQKVLKAA
jgi:hypothetical protein